MSGRIECRLHPRRGVADGKSEKDSVRLSFAKPICVPSQDTVKVCEDGICAEGTAVKIQL